MKRVLTLAAPFAAIATPAFAHVRIGSTASFAAGIGHPLSGLDHITVMVAVGLWAAPKGGRALWVWPVTFVGVMLVGGALGMAHVPVPFVEPGILASVVASASWSRWPSTCLSPQVPQLLVPVLFCTAMPTGPKSPRMSAASNIWQDLRLPRSYYMPSALLTLCCCSARLYVPSSGSLAGPVCWSVSVFSPSSSDDPGEHFISAG